MEDDLSFIIVHYNLSLPLLEYIIEYIAAISSVIEPEKCSLPKNGSEIHQGVTSTIIGTLSDL